MLVFSCSKEKDGVYFSETPNDVIVSKVSYSEIELEIIDLSDNWLRSNEHKKIIEDSG